MHTLLPMPNQGPDRPELTEDELTAHYEVVTDDRPHLRLNFVASVDGAASVHGRSAGLQTPADGRVFALLRDLADVVLVGAGTVRAERYDALRPGAARQARRGALGRAAVPTLAIVSAALDLDPAATPFTATGPRTIVITHANAPEQRRRVLAEVADLVVAGEDRIDLPGALAELAGRGLSRVLCEGGPQLFGALLAAGCVDELCLTVSPLLAGAAAGRIIAGPPLPHPARLRLTHLLTEDGALLCRYQIVAG
ncbi:MAG: pyrimidine reductase family protein [Actinobacteria bacterium]|nr:pyrimidine reductase family protein [Actinomycetota bacterium]